MTSSSPGGALPARHSSLKTHTHSPGNGLYQHTHTPGETTNIDADTQVQTRMQGNGPHQQRTAGVWANANTHMHTPKNSNKPEITLSVHVNLTPTHPCTLTGKGDYGIWKAIQWILISGHREFFSPLQRGCPGLGDTLQQAWGS